MSTPTTAAALPTGSDVLAAMVSAVSSMSEKMSSMSEALATAAVNKHMDMDMSGMSSMSGMSGMATSTGTAAAAHATSTGSSMGSHDMGGMDMGGGGSCNVAMLWNWNTIDSCFLSNGWHVTTRGKFAGTCIGVFLWVVFLVLLGSLRQKFDNHIASNAKRRFLRAHDGLVSNEDITSVSSVSKSQSSAFRDAMEKNALIGGITKFATRGDSLMLDSVRPSMLEQIVRALLFAFEYSITWLLGLILMSYNGYVIISAFIGAFIGFLLIEWKHVKSSEAITDVDHATPAAPKCC